MSESSKSVVRRYLEEPTGENLAAVDELFAPTAVVHDPGRPAPEPGPEGQKQVISGVFAAFPDFRFTVEDLVAEGDRVAARFVGEGTHRGALFGLPPTGRRVRFSGMAIYRVADGQIQEGWAMFDALGMLQQLGALPGTIQAG
jgi:steroid delta-isomerase-like uncharacterized protein